MASRWWVCGAVVFCACGAPDEPGAADDGPADAGPNVYAARVVDVQWGPHSGFGQDRFPSVVLGPPRGGGEFEGSTDVVSLGTGGSITLELGVDVVDGMGVDLVVFENPFRINGTSLVYQEPAEVSLSEDGVTFSAFPCVSTSRPYNGCAGLNPVWSQAQSGAGLPWGGDGFDLADVGLARARFVRIVDRSSSGSGDASGFDLDAVMVVNAGP
jgi:hypothetical protein